MANEAVLIHELEPPIPMTVADGTGIEKGTLLTLSDPLTAAATTADDAIVAGIAHSEKIASDGRTKLGVYRRGVFRVQATGANITVGDALSLGVGGGNNVKTAQATASGAHVIGYALETAVQADTFLMELNIQRAAGGLT